MRLLFLSNLYPPAGSGGYEQWCQEVAEGLRQRGHAVRVLTSQVDITPVSDPAEAGWVFRDLKMEMEFLTKLHSVHFFTQRAQREQQNLSCLRQHASDFKPDAILIWGMWNLPRSLPALAEELLPGRVVYYMGDYWPTLPSQHEFYWQSPAQSWKTRLPKILLKPVAGYMLARESPPALAFERVLFPSRFLQEEFGRRGVPLKETQVIPGAIDTRPFLNGSAAGQGQVEPVLPDRDAGKLSLLYAGRLSPEKGIETILDALHTLVVERGGRGLHLTIVGVGEPGYESELRERVRTLGLEDCVTFKGPAPKEAMPALYRQFDVFLFASIWQEPFGRVLVEALASGVVVIGSPTGGAAEILQEGENALTFRPGDAGELAQQILRVVEQPGLRRRLVENGRRTAVEKFDMQGMVSGIESYLESMLSSQGD